MIEKIVTSPHIHIKDSVEKIMLDVIIALFPAIIAAYFVYGINTILVILVSILSAIFSEWIFSIIFFKKYNSIFDLSAIVTVILLAFTLAPFTPLYVVAFGSSMGIIFSKMLYNGLGNNVFNPAIVGREFMSVFFKSIMSSGTIWYNQEELRTYGIKLFENDELNKIIFTNSGAIGEYSVVLLALGGIYLILKDRISIHIPISIFLVILPFLYILNYFGYNPNLSMGGLMLGAIYMATDMPTSPTTNFSKIYYGFMIGIVIVICWINGIKYEFLSYSILILNPFSRKISEILSPKLFGIKLDLKERVVKIIGVSIFILFLTAIVIIFHNLELIKYLLYGYIIYAVIRLIKRDEIV